MNLLAITANGASILTAIIAGGAGVYFWCDAHKKRLKVEEYLKNAKRDARPPKIGRHSVLHLMANLSLTEAEVLHAAFRSRRIKPHAAKDKETGLASEILLEYDDDRPK